LFVAAATTCRGVFDKRRETVFEGIMIDPIELTLGMNRRHTAMFLEGFTVP
jgi:hypothetical protein